MTVKTTRFELPAPEDAEAPNGPVQIKALADRTDLILKRGGQADSSVVATAETRAAEAYSVLTTPDRVAVVVATPMIIQVSFRALWKDEGATGPGGRAALFVNGEQLTTLVSATAPQSQAAAFVSDGTRTKYRPIVSDPVGLISPAGGAGDAAFGVPMTIAGVNPGPSNLQMELGGVLSNIGVSGAAEPRNRFGGHIDLIAGAGSYNIEVRYKTAGATDTITVKERTLIAWVRDELP